ncbi:MAG: hypothetical protein VYD07_07330 [Pseudomonadota bacterium]|nr:hypothetical protein [Pseudomonadota bacterium]
MKTGIGKRVSEFAHGILFALLTILCASYSHTVLAEQLSFEESSNDGELRFAYQWQMPNNQTASLSFNVDRHAFIRPFAKFRNYDRRRALRELNYRVNQYIQRQRWYGVQAFLSPRQEQMTIKARTARNEQLEKRYQQQLAKAQQFFTEQWQDYLSANAYRSLTLPPGETGIIPDAVAIAKQTQPLLSSLVVAIGNQLKDNSRRSYVNYVAHFVQAIPYDSLEDDLSSRGDGFTPPNHLLLNNRGDCDSKVSLTLALLRQIIPQAKMIVVYLPKHAIFGIQMARQPNDAKLSHDGTEFILLDVAGPAVSPAGQLSNDVQFLIDTQQYTVVPAN